MDKIQILDCTLRDGGYCNQWKFGSQNIKKIIRGLTSANIDIIECGFLTDRVSYHPDVTKFTSVFDVNAFIPEARAGNLYVLMMNHGEYDVNRIPQYTDGMIDGIRVAFHKKDMDEALQECQILKKKGYKVFVQAMVSLLYSEEEFLNLIWNVNEIEPYAFYIVDSFGTMKSRDLVRLFHMIERNMKQSISIGFHSHNNLQLAFSNAQQFLDMQSYRRMIVDASVYGMGRGAGNLNTELFVGYLNDCYHQKYQIKPLLRMIDEILNEFYLRNHWGYSLPNYLSASYNTHPNYAGYLDNKKTLTVQNMDEIFTLMDDEKRYEFDKEYIEQLYLRYMSGIRKPNEQTAEFREYLRGKRVLLVAPGKSAFTEKEKIVEFVKREEPLVISVNYDYSIVEPSYIFVSNIRRFQNIARERRKKCIITSNIASDECYLQISYESLLNQTESVKDNAGLMAIKFLMLHEVGEVYLAGFDGYLHDTKENYGSQELAFTSENSVLDAMNYGMRRVMRDYAKEIRLTFLTSPTNMIL